MRAFRYSLEAILKLRRLAQERCELRLAEALQAETLARQALDAFDARILAARQALPARPADTPVRPGYVRQLAEYVQLQIQGREAQQVVVTNACEQTGSCRMRLQDAAREVRRLERHRDHRQADWRQATMLEESRSNDEIGTGLATRRQQVDAEQQRSVRARLPPVSDRSSGPGALAPVPSPVPWACAQLRGRS